MSNKPKYADLGDFDEDKRVQTIGEAVMKHQLAVAFITDDEPGKVERYIEKLKARFPGIQIVSIVKGPIPNTVSVKVSPPVARN